MGVGERQGRHGPGGVFEKDGGVLAVVVHDLRPVGGVTKAHFPKKAPQGGGVEGVRKVKERGDRGEIGDQPHCVPGEDSHLGAGAEAAAGPGGDPPVYLDAREVFVRETMLEPPRQHPPRSAPHVHQGGIGGLGIGEEESQGPLFRGAGAVPSGVKTGVTGAEDVAEEKFAKRRHRHGVDPPFVTLRAIISFRREKVH